MWLFIYNLPSISMHVIRKFVSRVAGRKITTAINMTYFEFYILYYIISQIIAIIIAIYSVWNYEEIIYTNTRARAHVWNMRELKEETFIFVHTKVSTYVSNFFYLRLSRWLSLVNTYVFDEVRRDDEFHVCNVIIVLHRSYLGIVLAEEMPLQLQHGRLTLDVVAIAFRCRNA